MSGRRQWRRQTRLQRSQLVQPGGGDDAAGHVRARPVPGEEAHRRARRPVEAVGDEPVEPPRRAGSRRRRPTRHGACRAAPARGDAVEEHDHRRRRRQHHRRHHRHPDADVPAEPAEVGARDRRSSPMRSAVTIHAASAATIRPTVTVVLETRGCAQMLLMCLRDDDLLDLRNGEVELLLGVEEVRPEPDARPPGGSRR